MNKSYNLKEVLESKNIERVPMIPGTYFNPNSDNFIDTIGDFVVKTTIKQLYDMNNTYNCKVIIKRYKQTEKLWSFWYYIKPNTEKFSIGRRTRSEALIYDWNGRVKCSFCDNFCSKNSENFERERVFEFDLILYDETELTALISLEFNGNEFPLKEFKSNEYNPLYMKNRGLTEDDYFKILNDFKVK